MNLKRLFEAQKVLRDRIDYNEPDRFDKLILALLVELGECANEWRGFKFWSKDQKPRVKGKYLKYDCECNGGNRWVEKNPLLEEYVDGLHFILELGIELEIPESGDCEFAEIYCGDEPNVTDHFILIFQLAQLETYEFGQWQELFIEYVRLGQMLGFTWEEVEQAYFEKNAENHARQERGY
ncbi:dUTP diphosphatase [Mesobacillus zeae]|uniref:dUTPase n=1 Tax=Mesobacillus zeae TaxID=1917180 RepID=A0A398B815_9BACI|nr:dUTP diphosphatase [Mesobacillus zeae]RID85651.1 hypothetical protein D1970_08845 [Mesobacillus zeae]